jgi:hypothetical protein
MNSCAWHECNRPFTPTDPKQQFCGPACRISRGAWKARRGGPLVDLLLAGNLTGLHDAKKNIEKEIEDAKK